MTVPAPAALAADDRERRIANVGQDERADAAWRSRPDEIRVLGLQPVPARPALIEAALSFRHDALKAELAGLGEHNRALGGVRFVLK